MCVCSRIGFLRGIHTRQITANNWLRCKKIKFSSFRVFTTLLQWTSLAKKTTILFATIQRLIRRGAVARVTRRSLDPEKNWTRHATAAVRSLVLRPCSDDDADDRFCVDRELFGVRGDLSV